MNLRIIPALALIGLLSITSCMKDRPNPSDVQKEIKVSATIEGSTTSGAKTRASNSTWHDADAIGIYMKNNGNLLSSSALAENCKYVTDGTGNFSPTTSNEVYFPFNDDKVDFIAYYPYKDKLDGLNYPVDVSDQSKLPDIDLLYSNNVVGINATNGEVSLIFKHQLSKVILNISMLDDLQENLTGLTAKITNVNTTASFTLKDGTFSDGSNIKDVSFNMSADGKSAQAILLPVSSLKSMSLVLTLNDISYSLGLSAAKNITSFEKSTKHTLNVTLKPGEDPVIESVTATIEDWADGNTEEVTADEDSSYTPPGKPAEGDGGGENEDTGDENDLEEGDGTFKKPFTVEQAKTMSPTNNKWVKGYIVGYYALSSKNSLNENPVNQNNVAIADSPMETNPEQTFKINFNSNVYVGDPINLKNNPENKSKMAYFRGDIAQSKNISLLENVTEAFIVNNNSQE